MQKPLVTIGIPVYNGELTIKKCIESVLSQTYENLEIIISDNGSTDLTSDICTKFLKKDDRIIFVKQEKNMGQIYNFNFPLEKANGKYFVWVVTDTIILPEFIEKNIMILESMDKAVGSISKIKIISTDNRFKTEKEIFKKIGLVYRPHNASDGGGVISIKGNYRKRIRKYLRHFPWQMLLAVYRTEVLRESAIPEFLASWDASLVLNILKHGEIHVVDQFLLESYPMDTSTKNLNQVNDKSYSEYSQNKKNFLEQSFPFYPITKWCIDNLGWKLFFINFDHFVRLGLDGILLKLIAQYQKIR